MALQGMTQSHTAAMRLGLTPRDDDVAAWEMLDKVGQGIADHLYSQWKAADANMDVEIELRVKIQP